MSPNPALSFAICCLLLLSQYSSSQTTSRTSFNEIQLLFPNPSFTFYFLVLDPDFFDFTQSQVPVVIDDLLDRKMTGHDIKLNLKFTHFSLKKLPAIVILGSKPWQTVVGAENFMCNAPFHDGSLEYPGLLTCPYALSENVIFLMDQKITKRISIDSEHYQTLSRYSHVLLFLFYDQGRLNQGHAFCLYCNQSHAVTTALKCIKSLTSSDNEAQVDCKDIHNRYQSQLVVPAECVNWSIMDALHLAVGKPSPFHPSASSAIDALQCRNRMSKELRQEINIMALLPSQEGKYPAYSDLVLEPHSRPYLIISSDNVVLLGSGPNPFTSPFDSFTWLLVGGTLLSFILAALRFSLRVERKETCTNENIATTLFTTYGILLDQINGNIRHISKGSLAVRLLLVSLTLPTILLTNHYRSALQSEFTVRTEAYLDIESSEELFGYKVYLLFDGEQCKSYKSKLYTLTIDVKAVAKTCTLNPHHPPGCTFYTQASLASVWLRYTGGSEGASYRRAKLKRMESIYRNTSYACVHDIPQIVKSRGSGNDSKLVFMVSQTLVPAAWLEFAKLMQEDPSRVFAYKKDSEGSFFVQPRGFMIPLQLGPHQVWVRKKLRALFSSGIQLLWIKWKRIRLDRRMEKMWANYTAESIRKPRGISLKESWISVFISVCGWSLAVSAVVFGFELDVFARGLRRFKLATKFSTILSNPYHIA